jgi:transposase-like protein
VQNRAIYVAIGIRMDGSKEALGLWVSATEGVVSRVLCKQYSPVPFFCHS